MCKVSVLLPVLLLAISAGAGHGQQPASTIRADAVLRPGMHGSWRTDRDGTSSERHDLRMRAQLGAWWTPTSRLAFRGRIAGRLSTDQEAFHFHMEGYVPTVDGMEFGDFTVDEAYVRWRPTERVQLRAGRMQTSFELAGVPRKSLDRNDSPNTDVTWTDGVHTSILLREGLRHHLIIQRNESRGATNTVRPPLDFSSDRSRVTVFTALQLESHPGPFVQRELDLTYLRGVVPPGETAGAPADYVAIVARAAVQPAIVLGGRFVVGAEGGIASGAPRRVLVGTGTDADGSADGWAFQVSASILEMGSHSVGIVHSQAGDGWLLSPDIRDNNREVEARYYWQFAPWGRLDARARFRTDMHMRVDALERRRDRDVYLRTTLRI